MTLPSLLRWQDSTKKNFGYGKTPFNVLWERSLPATPSGVKLFFVPPRVQNAPRLVVHVILAKMLSGRVITKHLNIVKSVHIVEQKIMLIIAKIMIVSRKCAHVNVDGTL